MTNPMIVKFFLVVLLLTAHFMCAGAVNLDTCGARLQQQQNAIQSATNTTVTSNLTISYQECVTECGGGLGNIDWAGLSQDFGAWLLPWISLMFQIPFGAERESQISGSNVVLANENLVSTNRANR